MSLAHKPFPAHLRRAHKLREQSLLGDSARFPVFSAHDLNWRKRGAPIEVNRIVPGQASGIDQQATSVAALKGLGTKE